ncbi:MAG TPA: RNA polymerase sigma factor [Chitinispirillaceae bacterium]|nr:RNA polymerase sigma factor [Chitinispirillaceae bacterium]
MSSFSTDCMHPEEECASEACTPLESVRNCMIENRAQLINVALRITYSREAAEDIIQDVYLSLCTAGEQFKGLSSPKTYAYRMVINRSIDYIRKIKRSRSLLENVFISNRDKPVSGDSFETKELVAKMFNKIPDQFRVPLILAELKDMSYEEIADTLLIPVNTIKTRIFRGREKLRKVYEKLEIIP